MFVPSVRFGSIRHVSGREVDVGLGEGLILKYVRTKLESEFLIE